MKIEMTPKELQLVVDSLEYRENSYAHSGAEVLPELNAVNGLYNRLSAIRERMVPILLDQEEEPELTRKKELRRQVDSLTELLMVLAMERNAELRNDPTVDQERIGDLLRIELAQIEAEGNRL